MRPKVDITGYVDEKANVYIVKKEYREHPDAAPEIECAVFFSLYEMSEEIRKHVKEAKKNTYDYRVDYETLYCTN